MRHSQVNVPNAADQPESRLRLMLPTASLAVIVLISLMWLSCSSENETAANETSRVEQSADQSTNQVPPPEHYTGGSSVYFPEPKHDFGHIDQGDKVTHTFIVQNYGDEPLKLIKAKAS